MGYYARRVNTDHRGVKGGAVDRQLPGAESQRQLRSILGAVGMCVCANGAVDARLVSQLGADCRILVPP
jgi:hypothetical protein